MGINFKEYNENNQNPEFKALPEGRYNVVIDAATLTTAKNGTTQMIKVAFTVTDGKFKNRKLWSNFTLTPKSYVYIFNLLKAVGSALVDQTDVNEEEICKGLVGGKCSVWTDVTTGNNGKEQNNVSGYKAIEGATGSAPAANGSTTTPSATRSNLFG